MQEKKQPMRTCIVCRKKKKKHELIRIVKTSDGEFHIDVTGRLNGRGAYICNSEECFEKLIKSKALNRTFKCEVDNSVYLKLKEELLARSN